MISPEILLRLVPENDPEEDWPREPFLSEFSLTSPGGRIGLWASYLRYRIHRDMQEDQSLSDLIGSSGFVGTGIFRVSSASDKRDREGFPNKNGYQFGAMLMRGARVKEGASIPDIFLESGRYSVPVIQMISRFNPHAPTGRDGYISAVFDDEKGASFGITARHVVEGYRHRQKVPVECSDCGCPARLAMKAPGYIDAAMVELPCGGPAYNYTNGPQTVRSAVEGESVVVHFGDTGKTLCTVMQALSSPTEIKCAAAPKHFLTDINGHPGDSGSLVSGLPQSTRKTDLIGMYLGDTECEDDHQNYVTYGYSLDLKQAADILGATGLMGDYNV